MNTSKVPGFLMSLALALATAAFGVPQSLAITPEGALTLSGDDEVPPVKSAASGSGSITVGADKSVSGGITTTGITATAAHIHVGSKGSNGPVIIPLTKKGDNEWLVPAGARLTDEQYGSYKAGNLYVNVHSAANPGGEIRAQLKP